MKTGAPLPASRQISCCARSNCAGSSATRNRTRTFVSSPNISATAGQSAQVCVPFSEGARREP